MAAVVAHQVALARELGAQALRVVATSAVREAVDAAAMAAAVAAACGVALEILSGEDEARLAFAGATGCSPTRRRACSASSTSAAARPSSSSAASPTA